MKKIIALSFVAALLLSTTACQSVKQLESTSSSTASVSSTPAKPLAELLVPATNPYNWGTVLDGGFLYYTGVTQLMRFNPTTDEDDILYTVADVTKTGGLYGLQVYNDWIYFFQGDDFCKIGINGQNFSVIQADLKGVGPVCRYDSTIVAHSALGVNGRNPVFGGAFALDVSGTPKEVELSSIKGRYLMRMDGITEEGTGMVCAANTTGTDVTDVMDDVLTYIFDGTTLYYNKDHNGAVYSANADGSGEKLLYSDTDGSVINSDEEWLYCRQSMEFTQHPQPVVFRIRKDGSGREDLPAITAAMNESSAYTIDLAGEWIMIHGSSGNPHRYRTRRAEPEKLERVDNR